MAHLEIFSVLPTKDGRGGKAFRLPLWGPMFKLPLCPFVLGGKSFNLARPINLTEAHYSQSDKSNNAKLWSEHTWELLNLAVCRDLDELLEIEQRHEKELHQ